MAATQMEKKKLQKSYFDVLGLCCSSEVQLIENILKSLDGVKECSVIVATRTVIVVHDNLLISQLQIVKALNQARLEANVRVHGNTSHQKKWPSPFAVASGLLLLVSLFKYLYHPLRWFALGAVAVGILPIFLKGVASIRNFRLDTNILMLVAVVGTIAMKDFIEAGTIVFLFTIAEWLESRASHKANAVMSSLMSMAPQKAVIAETGQEVDADEVKLNTVLAVKAGEVIPIDGIVVDGNSEVDEKTLTGESFPVPKQVDSTVWAGTINLNGYISVKTTALAEDCVVAKMAKLVEEAQNSKSKTQRFIDKCAQYYTPAVIIISASLAVVPFVFKVHNRNHWFYLALVVLVSACPCALILSTPVATFCALTKAATAGLLIKGGDYLETLAKIKAMAFDKTGTITRGEFVVTDFQPLCDDISMDTLLYWVSSIESKSSHPMAAALIDYGRLHSIEPKPENVEEFQNYPGEGIQGKINGKDIYIGNRKIANRAGSGTVPRSEGHKKTGKTIGYVYCGATPAGIFSLSDSCRTGVAEAIRELRSMGIKTAMLTGDSEAAATYAQEQLKHALEEVHAELLPEDKAMIIKELKKGGPTAMIGDGLNDAPALATADIGISMGISGSALATETGHIILMSNDIRKVPKAIQLARRAHRKVIENVVMSMTTKSAILALAFAGHPLVWAAVLADVGTCLLVIFNSMLLLRQTHNHATKCCKSSSAPHSHEHGQKNLSQHDCKNCCSSQKVEKVQCGAQNSCCASQCQKVEKVQCRAQNSCCASQCQSIHLSASSCGNDKCTDSAERHDGSIGANAYQVHEAKHCDQGGCDAVNHDIEANHPHSHDCSSPHKLSLLSTHNCESSVEGDGQLHQKAKDHHRSHHDCKNSAEAHGKGIEGDGHQKAKHCHHSLHYCENSVATEVNHIGGDCHHKAKDSHHSHHEPATCYETANHSNHSSHDLEEDVKLTDTPANCRSDRCCNGHDSSHCENKSFGEIVESSCNHQHESNHSCKAYSDPCHTAMGIGTTAHACMSLEKREIGGCCRSYMKECCGKHGHFAAGFGGGLSEIIIKEV